MHITEISEKIEICAYCPMMCQDICTIYYETKNQATSPTLQQFLLWSINEGKEEYSKDIADLMYECCCGCLLCQSWCATDQDLPEKVRAARRDIVELNLAPRSVLDLNESTLKFHNPFKEAHEKRFKKIAYKTGTKERRGEIAIFAGCATAYHQPEILDAIITILEQANLNFDLMNEGEWCCGLPQWELGLEETAKTLAEHNSNYINNSKCKIVLTSCPECYYMLKEVYPKLGFPINAEIQHFSETINSLIIDRSLRLKGSFKKRITYHDPCYLGRYAKIFDEPRKLIKHINGAEFVEMRWIKDKAYCCGGNEGFTMTNPELSAKIGMKVIDEAEKEKAKAVITACPLCKELLMKHSYKKGIEVFDLAEIIKKIL